MEEKLVLLEKTDRLAYITLNRPDKRNAMGPELVDRLKQIITDCEKDNDIKTIILKANGSVFSAGADLAYLKELQSFSFEDNLKDSNNLKELYQKIYLSKKVIIAQVEGHAIAGGCGLATVCDFIFSVPEAKFGYTESRIGFVPALVMVYLLRKIGEAKAKPLLLFGNLITAEEAKTLGIVYEVVSQEKISEHVTNFAMSFNENVSAESIKLVKEMIASVQGMKLEDGLEFASKMNAVARSHDDCKKGIEKFLNKEQIKW